MRIITDVFNVKVTMQKNSFFEITALTFGIKAGMTI